MWGRMRGEVLKLNTGPGTPERVVLTNHAQMTKRHSLKKPRRTSKSGTVMEEFEPIQEGFIQILIKKEHLEELQSILTIQPHAKDISPAEITSLCGILADCGILNNKEN